MSAVARARGVPRRSYEWLRRQPQLFSDARRLSPAALRSDVAYLGFSGQRNIGDDAIVEAHERWTVGRPMNSLPVHHIGEVLRRTRGPRRRLPVLLGGGTLVGRADWLRRVRAYEAGGWVSSWSLSGIGVEDPEFAGRRRHTSWDDLKAWAEVLPWFGDVTVRGPRSQQILAEVGVASRVVGDPALLFALQEADVAVQPDLVAMSVAVPEDVWGGEPGAAIDALGQAAARLVELGHRVRLVALHPADLEPSQRVAAAVGRPGAVEVLSPANTDELVAAVRPCGALVGQRLHAVVLGSAVGVPSLAIEYRPKCLDFQRSLGRDEWTVSTRGISAEPVVERTLALLADRDRHSAQIGTAVKGLVDELLAEGARLRTRTGSRLDTDRAGLRGSVSSGLVR